MEDKTLHNSDVNGAKENVRDLEVYGNGDLWRLLSKASSKRQGWLKSTKVMPVMSGAPVNDDDHHHVIGCLVQVTTQQRNPDGSYAVAEAVTFVPGARMESFDFPKGVL